ncbi:Uncharacterised protein [Streptococcus pneumoniae]|nr:Uncharacterised protein [Streptococcus pneumoniae]
MIPWEDIDEKAGIMTLVLNMVFYNSRSVQNRCEIMEVPRRCIVGKNLVARVIFFFNNLQ